LFILLHETRATHQLNVPIPAMLASQMEACPWRIRMWRCQFCCSSQLCSQYWRNISFGTRVLKSYLVRSKYQNPIPITHLRNCGENPPETANQNRTLSRAKLPQLIWSLINRSIRTR